MLIFNTFSGKDLFGLSNEDTPFIIPTTIPTVPKSPATPEHVETISNVIAACNPVHRLVDEITSMSVRTARRCLHKGEHIKCNRIGYSHHGIYDDNGRVYEYNEGEIRLVPLAAFADGDEIVRVHSVATYSDDDIIRRAHSRLGEQRYDLLFNNCEHYALWCRNGNKIYLGPF